MGAAKFEAIPQTFLTIRGTSTYSFAEFFDVSRYDQIVVELVLMNPPTLAANNVKLHIKTANEETPSEGFDAYAAKTIAVGATVAGTPYVKRAVWRRAFDPNDNSEPLQTLVALALENTSATDKTLDVRVSIIGCGGACSG